MKFTFYHFVILYPLLLGAIYALGVSVVPTPTTPTTTSSFPWQGGGD